jgi:hypothetical protein
MPIHGSPNDTPCAGFPPYSVLSEALPSFHWTEWSADRRRDISARRGTGSL